MTRQERWKTILVIAWPLVVANSFWNLQITIDRIFLGQYSTESLGAAIAVMGVFWTPMALLQQTVAYSTTFVAQYFGANRFDEIGPAVWQSILLSIGGGLLFLGLIPISAIIFQLIGHSPTMIELEIDYFNALCFSALPIGLTAAASAFFTGKGQTQTIIWINISGLIANVFFDYLLIFGNWGAPELGIQGAGYATALASYVSAAFGLYLVFSHRQHQLYQLRNSWHFQMDLMKRFLKYGLPSGLQWALEGLAFTFFLIIVGRMPNGDAALASSGIVITILMLAILPGLGMGQAVAVKVGQYLGEKRSQEAQDITWSGLQIAMIYIVLISLSFAFMPQFYLSWFAQPESNELWEQVAQIVPSLLLFLAVFTAFDCMNIIFSFTLKGAGDTRFVSAVALLLPWPLMVAPARLVQDWPSGIYWAWGAASFYIIVQAFIFTWRFRQGKWKEMSVIN